MAGQAFDGVIFDMDSTLVDSLPAIVRVWTRFAERYRLTAEDLSGLFGLSSGAIVDLLVPAERRAEALAWITEHELSDQEGVVALPGAAHALAAAGERAAVATSATRPMAYARLAAAGLPQPAVLVTASDVVRAKPDPQIFLAAAAGLGVDPARCLVAEDAPNGLRAARAAGMATVAVTTTHTAEQLAPLADVVVPDLSHVGLRLDGARVLVSAPR
ncbi:HAD-IA family hydrolase [Raineyella fluvialis]|uniref:HAD-IA family hydrolase n=1 Tax=Raineyella fluvialis TaxID=2662261 RepID=A0A5Q2F9Z6_9ACTN|nr:HAD-IA family hydrolase [Raineyella fluvialis]QGF23508.1 HAD-IA family hydrolase [Raineyella fluvialis]